METSKQTIRNLMRRRRLALGHRSVLDSGLSVARRVVELAEFRAADSLVAYAPTRNEVPTAAIIDSAHAAGKAVFLPRLLDGALGLARHDPGRPLRKGAFGIGEPQGPTVAEIGTRPLVLIPLVAFDRAGTRLGNGGGHYDRAAASWPRSATKVGLAYAMQESVSLPRDPWDAPLDMVVTESEVVRCGAGVGIGKCPPDVGSAPRRGAEEVGP